MCCCCCSSSGTSSAKVFPADLKGYAPVMDRDGPVQDSAKKVAAAASCCCCWSSGTSPARVAPTLAGEALPSARGSGGKAPPVMAGYQHGLRSSPVSHGGPAAPSADARVAAAAAETLVFETLPSPAAAAAAGSCPSTGSGSHRGSSASPSPKAAPSLPPGWQDRGSVEGSSDAAPAGQPKGALPAPARTPSPPPHEVGPPPGTRPRAPSDP